MNERGLVNSRSLEWAFRTYDSGHRSQGGIIEDQPKIREGLRALIDGTEGYRCVGSFGSMEEAFAKVDYELPDVLLVDIGLPGMSGIEGTRRLKDRHPELAVLMLTFTTMTAVSSTPCAPVRADIY